MLILPGYSTGIQILMSNKEFDMFRILVGGTLFLVAALVLTSIYLYHALSLLKLALVPESSTATPQPSDNFLSYWVPRPHLPPISRPRVFLYSAADLTCLASCHIIYQCELAWWAIVALHFVFMSMLVFVRTELQSRVHQIFTSTECLPIKYGLAGAGSFLVAMIFGYGALETLDKIALLSLSHTLLGILYKPELKSRFKSITNQSKLGPGYLPMTPCRPFTPRVHVHNSPLSQNVPSPAPGQYPPSPVINTCDLLSMPCSKSTQITSAGYTSRVLYASNKERGKPVPGSLMERFYYYHQHPVPCTSPPSTLGSVVNTPQISGACTGRATMYSNENHCENNYFQPNVYPSSVSKVYLPKVIPSTTSPSSQLSSLPAAMDRDNKNQMHSPNVLPGTKSTSSQSSLLSAAVDLDNKNQIYSPSALPSTTSPSSQLSLLQDVMGSENKTHIYSPNVLPGNTHTSQLSLLQAATDFGNKKSIYSPLASDFGGHSLLAGKKNYSNGYGMCNRIVFDSPHKYDSPLKHYGAHTAAH